MRRGASVWTGEELWVLGGFGDPNGRAGTTAAAAYTPRTDTWRGLPDAPVLVGATAWSSETRQTIVVDAGAATAGPRLAWALDGDGSQWRELPRTPALPDRDEELFSLAAGDGGVYLAAEDATWRLDLRDQAEWVRLPDRPLAPGRGDAPLTAWTGGGLLTVNGDSAAWYEPWR